MTTPISGIIGSLGSLCMFVLRDTVFVHFSTVRLHEDTPVVTALQQETVVSPDVIVDTGVVARGVAASGTKSQSGWLSAVCPPCILLADGIILVDTIQTYHQVGVPVIIMAFHNLPLRDWLHKRLHNVLGCDTRLPHLLTLPFLQSCQEPHVMRASQTLELLDPVVQTLNVDAKGLLTHQLSDIVGVVVIVMALRQMVDGDGSALTIPDCQR